MLVLLGEAGMGKSDTLRDWVQRLRLAGATVVFIECREHSTEQSIEAAIDERAALSSPPDGPQFVIIDGVDESPMGIGPVLRVVASLAESAQHRDIRVRLSCRTTAWTQAAAERVGVWREVPGGEEVWHLMPLRKEDVDLAAKQSGLDTVDMRRAIREFRLAAFASRPITLAFIVNAARTRGLGPDRSLCEVFRTGLEALASEVDRAKQELGLRARLSPGARMQLASRLAAVTAFGQCAGFCFGTEGDPNGVYIPVSSALGRFPYGMASNGLVTLEPNQLQEFLNCGLFTQGPRGVYRFSHKSYAEFLAACYVKDSGLTPTQIDGLFWVDDGRQRRVAPPLIETAAWLGALDARFFEQLMAVQPEILILSDTAALAEVQRERLVDSYLQRVESQEVGWDRIRGLEDSYSRVSHATLENQLSRYLADKSLRARTREVATDLASRCRCHGCAPVLIDLVLNEDEPIRLRVAAAYALRDLEVEAQVRRLLPIVNRTIRGDDDQSILGCVLHLLWPAHLSADELFQALVPEFRTNLYGAYAAFLTSWELAAGLPDADLVAALRWVQSQAVDRYGHICNACDSIIRRAWMSLGASEIARAMAGPVLDRMTRGEYFMGRSWNEPEGRGVDDHVWLNNEIQSDPGRRRALLNAVVAEIARRKATDPSAWQPLYLLVGGDVPLCLRDDLEWVIERTMVAAAEEQTTWVELCNRLVLGPRASAWTSEEVSYLAHALQDPRRPRSLLDYLDPVDIDSARADELRKDLAEYAKLGRKPRRKKPAHPLREIIESWFAAAESNPADVWVGIAHMLMFGTSWDDNRHGTWQGGELITTTKLWESADVRIRERITNAARRLLTSCSPIIDDLVRNPTQFGEHVLMLQAMLLLVSEDPGFLERLPDERWRAWSPLVAAWADHPDPDHEEERRLVEMVYARAPTEVIRTLVDIVRFEHVGDKDEARLWRWASVADKKLVKPLETALGAVESSPAAKIGCALRLLLSVDPAAGLRAARRFLNLNPANGEAGVTNRLSAAAGSALARWAPDGGWQEIWPRMKADQAWARSIMLGQVSFEGRDAKPLYEKLDDAALGELVEWLYTDFEIGHVPDYLDSDLHPVASESELDRWRTHAMSQLVERRSRESIRALERLCSARPENWWFREKLLQAREAAASAQWRPIGASELDCLVEDGARVFITSPAQLLGLVRKSVERFQARLQDSDAPLRENLWNRSETGKATPKDEMHFAINLKDHLDTDLRARGLVVNREVQILRPRLVESDEQGKRLDLLVQAVDPTGAQPMPIGIVVEVKLDTNEKRVRQDLEAQLFGRYLNEHRCTHGLYVVNATRGDCTATRQLATDLDAACIKLSAQDAGTRIVESIVVDCGLGKDTTSPHRRPAGVVGSQYPRKSRQRAMR